MLKRLSVFVVIFLAGFVIGNAFWYLASPLWIDVVVAEELPEGLQLQQVAEGQFKDADFAHKGEGTAKILQSPTGASVLTFSNFKVTNGPDLKVYLVSSREVTSNADFNSSKRLKLGPLKGNVGDQFYVLPEGEKASDYGSAVIWCEQFGVLFSAASLQ